MLSIDKVDEDSMEDEDSEEYVLKRSDVVMNEDVFGSTVTNYDDYLQIQNT